MTPDYLSKQLKQLERSIAGGQPQGAVAQDYAYRLLSHMTDDATVFPGQQLRLMAWEVGDRFSAEELHQIETAARAQLDGPAEQLAA